MLMRGIVSGCFVDIKKFCKNGKLDKVVAIIKSCTPNALGDLTVTLKDLSGTISSSINYKVLTDEGFGMTITVGVALILRNVSMFSPNQSTQYINITKKNMVNVFHKDGGLRIEQYFQVQDYALWDVIENGNSFKLVHQTTTNADGSSTLLIPGPVTTEEKVQKKNDVKERSFRRLNKPYLDIMSFDDLYNNFKIVEQEVKGTTSSSSSSQNMAFVSSPSSTNEVNTAYGVSTANTQVSPASTQVSPASTQVSTASAQVSTANLSDDTIYAFLAISIAEHEDKKVFPKSGRKITINGSDTAGYDKSKVKCFNCHKIGHFARECRGPRNQDSRNMNQYGSRRTVNVEETSSKAMVAIDGAGLFSPPNLDLSYSGLEEFQQPKFEGYEPKTSKSVSEDISNKVRESPDAPLVEELESDDKLEKKTIFPTVAKIEFVRPKQQEKPIRKPVKYAGMYRLTAITIKGKGWNIVPRAVLMKTGLRLLNNARPVHPQKEDQDYVNSGCSRHIIGDMSYLSNFKEFDGGYVTFRGGAKGGKITSKGTLKCVDMRNIVPKESLTCLVAKAILDESMLWHRRLGHVNFKTINKLVKENLVRGLPTKRFENDQTCVVCLKGKQHKASSTKDETSGILKSFIPEVENLVDKKIKIIRCDNGTEFKNRVMSEFCEKKGIKKEFSIARTPQQNGVTERINMTLIEAARTIGRTPALSFMRPFGCHVTILNTLDYLGKFDGKSDEGFFIRYSMNSDEPKWLFDIDVLTKSINYVSVVAGTNANDLVGTEESIGAGHSSKETGSSQDYILMLLWKDGSLFDSSSKNASNDEPQPSSDAGKKDDECVNKESEINDQERPENSTPDVNTVGPSINTASTNVNTSSLNINTVSPIVTTAPLEVTHVDFFGNETEVDMSNITTTYQVPSTLNTRIHKDHSLDHVISDVQSGVQTRRMTKTTNEQGFISVVYEGKTHEDLHTCLFACFLSQLEPKKVIQALTDPTWIEAMHDELLQFKLQKVWTLVNLPYGKKAIGTKWVYRNKKDERGIVIRNKARLVAQGYTQEE
ncbi:putative ribonuclease H-like domain-containing protein [Tanacetum coccineum]